MILSIFLWLLMSQYCPAVTQKLSEVTEEFVSINNLWNNYRWEHFQTIWEASKSLKSEVEATKVYNW